MRAAVNARIDLSAIEHNTRVLRDVAGPAQVMAVVKAEGYGHALVESARAAQAGGATWLGAAVIGEALRLRQAGIRGPVLAWLHSPGDRWAEAVDQDIDVSVGARWTLREIEEAAQQVGKPARVHLEFDSGMGRGGCPRGEWRALVKLTLRAQRAGHVSVVGLWSHLASADLIGAPTTDAQVDAFREALEEAERLGVRPEVRHLANSAATFLHPRARFDLVRPGIALFGLSPLPAPWEPASFGLRPAMTLTARLALVKKVPPGHGVSYSHAYVTARESTPGLVPVGYADGIPRGATNLCQVSVAGQRRRIVGRVCMDQFVVDFGHDACDLDEEVVIFGPGEDGEPTIGEWAQQLDTIPNEIVSRLAHTRIARQYV
ncbi:alanine racemase [Streptomyces sp. NPDC005820]|uniref:alanine racemase n=1 Tax=Streptomyces sp. NPDC005820 TaxID=3157069 RepID=UPI0033E5AFEA